jgi:hypothetical protein
MLLKPAVIQIAEEVNSDGQAAASEGLIEFSPYKCDFVIYA